MKTLLLIKLCIAFASISVYSQVVRIDTVKIDSNGIENLLIEVNEVDDGVAASDENLAADAYCYRIFLDLESYSYSATDSIRWKFLACGPNAEQDILMTIESTEDFYNETDFGTDKGTSVLSALVTTIAPELEYDSYVADGRIGTDNVGVLKSVDPSGMVAITTGSTPASDIIIPAQISVLTQDTTEYEGTDGWVSPGGISGPDTTTNVVLIAQLTTAGDLSFVFNVSTLGVDHRNNEGNITNRYDADDIRYPVAGAPSVSITSPQEGDNFDVDESITIIADASDEGGSIVSVEFFVDGSSIGTDTDTPYEIDWDVTEGNHVLTAVATDNDSETTTSSPVNISGVPDAFEDIFMNAHIRIHPNPSAGIYHLDIAVEEEIIKGSYTLYDMVGNKLMEQTLVAGEKSMKEVLDITGYAGGTYILRLTLNDASYNTLLIKQ